MPDLKPRFPIRRFDVFADYNRVKNEAVGMPADQAKGRAVWIAKVVAGRRGGGAVAAEPGQKRGEGGAPHEEAEDKFRSVGGVPQTDATFDKEIVDRMGQEFYHEVFHPAIKQAFKEGRRYEDIRDTIRKAWK
jgi:hypothetical protein